MFCTRKIEMFNVLIKFLSCVCSNYLCSSPPSPKNVRFDEFGVAVHEDNNFSINLAGEIIHFLELTTFSVLSAGMVYGMRVVIIHVVSTVNIYMLFFFNHLFSCWGILSSSFMFLLMYFMTKLVKVTL